MNWLLYISDRYLVLVQQILIACAFNFSVGSPIYHLYYYANILLGVLASSVKSFQLLYMLLLDCYYRHYEQFVQLSVNGFSQVMVYIARSIQMLIVQHDTVVVDSTLLVSGCLLKDCLLRYVLSSTQFIAPAQTSKNRHTFSPIPHS